MRTTPARSAGDDVPAAIAGRFVPRQQQNDAADGASQQHRRALNAASIKSPPHHGIYRVARLAPRKVTRQGCGRATPNRCALKHEGAAARANAENFAPPPREQIVTPWPGERLLGPSLQSMAARRFREGAARRRARGSSPFPPRSSILRSDPGPRTVALARSPGRRAAPEPAPSAPINRSALRVRNSGQPQRRRLHAGSTAKFTVDCRRNELNAR